MNERIKELAEQAGLDMRYLHCIEGDIDDLERFAELVRQDEREACAKLCDELLAHPNIGGGWSDATIECSVQIRAKGNT